MSPQCTPTDERLTSENEQSLRWVSQKLNSVGVPIRIGCEKVPNPLAVRSRAHDLDYELRNPPLAVGFGYEALKLFRKREVCRHEIGKFLIQSLQDRAEFLRRKDSVYDFAELNNLRPIHGSLPT